ncbi:MAG: type II secretion system protein [Hydrogenophaga sp.]|jgi:type II secretory pathway pseudopilin PulG
MTNGERQRGAGYLFVLFAMAAIGIGLATTGEVWRTSAQREREAQLLFVGHQFRLALASYREASPLGMPIAPATLDELIEDRRHPAPRRHLRRLWRDPMTGSTDWGLVVVGGRIVGVYSRDTREPLRTAFAPRDAEFAGLASYSQWVFLAAEAAKPAGQAPLDPTPNVTRSPS